MTTKTIPEHIAAKFPGIKRVVELDGWGHWDFASQCTVCGHRYGNHVLNHASGTLTCPFTTIPDPKVPSCTATRFPGITFEQAKYGSGYQVPCVICLKKFNQHHGIDPEAYCSLAEAELAQAYKIAAKPPEMSVLDWSNSHPDHIPAQTIGGKLPYCRSQHTNGMGKNIPCSEFLTYDIRGSNIVDPSPESLFLCDVHCPLYQKSKVSFHINALATPLPNSKFIPVSQLVCEIKKRGWPDYGECAGEITGEIKLGGSWYPICSGHFWHFTLKNEECPDFSAIRPLSGEYTAAMLSYKPPKPFSQGDITREKIARGEEIRTQKARGLYTLKNYGFPVPQFKIYDALDCKPETLIGKFVRPCPVRPRHGFVDSRVVHTKEDAELIIKQTLEADPDAEFLLMSHIDAPFSGIWTPGYLAIGKGTDGATAGKSAVTIPVLGDYIASVSDSSAVTRTSNIQSAPYMEILWQKDTLSWGTTGIKYELKTVQLRDGPKLPPDCTDYIPEKFEVREVIQVHEGDDLLQWETRMQELKGTPVGTVVYHPGGTMASHYAVHAVLNNIPVAITFNPKLGDILEPTTKKLEPNTDAMRAGFVMACDTEINMAAAANFMLLGCHSTIVWLGKHDLLLGAAMGFAWRLTVAAALGEERHYHRRNRKILDRDMVYKRVWNKSDTQYAKIRFHKALDLFLNGNNWPGKNYGGYSWYKFTINAVHMYNALVTKNPQKALEALNQLVHSAHNTGWGFNKFVDKQEMDRTALNPVYSAMKVGPYLYQLLTADNQVIKTAARSFWKRVVLEIPDNRGTGANLPDDEDDSDADADYSDVPKILSHLALCDCMPCQKKRFVNGKGKQQFIEYAQAFHDTTNHIIHIQFTTQLCSVSGHSWYYTRNISANGLPKQSELNYKEKPSLAHGSEKMYMVLEHKENGWGLTHDSGSFYKLLPEEVIPDGTGG
jgi:hypothetical protein